MTRWPYRSGSHLVTCDVCGQRLFSHDAKKTWDNLIVHPRCFDERHPQETIQTRKDRITVTDPRPEGPYTFLSPGDVTRDDL